MPSSLPCLLLVQNGRKLSSVYFVLWSGGTALGPTRLYPSFSLFLPLPGWDTEHLGSCDRGPLNCCDASCSALELHLGMNVLNKHMYRNAQQHWKAASHQEPHYLSRSANRAPDLLTKCLDLSEKSAVLGTGEELFKRQVSEIIIWRKTDLRKIIWWTQFNREGNVRLQQCRSVKLCVGDNQSIPICCSRLLHASWNTVWKGERVARYT